MTEHAFVSLARLAAAGLAVAPLFCAPVAAQPGGFGPGGFAPQAPAARAAAPIDLTGYWVSIVTEDWIERMAPESPPSGSGGGGFGRGGGPAQPASNPEDPCRVYGAGGSMRMPGRVHITWADDQTLQLDLDAGSQQRLFHFDPAAVAVTGEKSLQGVSIATWDMGQTGRGGGFGFGGRGGPPAPPAWGKLEVVTTGMTGGYLLSSRTNYSDQAVLTEHFSYHSAFGNQYFTVTAVLEDGGTVNITSSTFKKEPDGAKFEPTGCEIRP